MLKNVMIVLALTLTTVGIASANDERRENIEHQIADMKTRLALSDAQTEQITPILEKARTREKRYLKNTVLIWKTSIQITVKNLAFARKDNWALN